LEDRYFKEYEKNQYEDYNCGKFMYGEEVVARYIEQEEPTYVGNVLIEALPPISTYEDFCNNVEKLPVFSVSERAKTETYRLHAIYRLLDYLSPTTKYFDVEAKISIAIRRGYIGKRIMTSDYIKKLRFTSELLSDNWKMKSYKGALAASASNASDSPGFSIIGVSGAGKTTAVNNILSLYPQSILHTGIDDEKYVFRQLSWLKIDCTYNGSIKGICQKFFAMVDKVLNTDYLVKFGQRISNIDSMIVAMAHIAQKHALGLLVIDEIQHLKRSHYGGTDALNFFVCMMNEIKLPILYIGTYKAIENLFGREHRQGRRADGLGCIEWNRLDNGPEWDYFLEDMWKYQWIKNECVLTKEIKDMMYKKSIGIIDRAKKIFMAIQFRAIADGTETITVDKIIEVADKDFMLTKKAIDALESGNPLAIAEFEDLKHANIKAIFEYTLDDVKRKEDIVNIIQGQRKVEKENKNKIISDIVLLVSSFGYDYDTVTKATEQIVHEHGNKKEIEFLRKAVINLLLSNEKYGADAKNDSSITAKSKKKKTKIDIDDFKNRNVTDVLEGIVDI
jgi:hypothetical protein